MADNINRVAAPRVPGPSRSLTVLPGSPALPASIQVTCEGLDPARGIELLIGRLPVALMAIESDGSVNFSYTIPVGDERDQVMDLTSCTATGIVEHRDILCGIRSGSGNDMGLQYSSVG